LQWICIKKIANVYLTVTDSAEDLIKKADRAMYKVKKQTKNLAE